MLKDFASTIEVDIKLCWGSDARTQEQRMGDRGSRMLTDAHGCWMPWAQGTDPKERHCCQMRHVVNKGFVSERLCHLCILNQSYIFVHRNFY